MISSFRLGSNDVEKARIFYDATFDALGGAKSMMPAGSPMALYIFPNEPAFLIGAPLDGEPACHANGGTILLEAKDESMVDAWHAAGLAHGGSCEGQPGAREKARGRYGAYLRDPDGNKLGCYVGNLFEGLGG